MVLKYILTSLFALSLIGIISSSDDPVSGSIRNLSAPSSGSALIAGNSLIFDASIGVFTSIFFWFLLVFIPERKKRKILRNNLDIRYRQFKEEINRILLSAIGASYEYDLPSRLCSHSEFRSFYNSNEKANWYAALNGLQSNENLMRDIVVEMDLLLDEVSHAINNVYISDDKVFAFFKNFSGNVYRLRNSSVYSDDNVKYIGQFIWSTLARWSIVDGQRKEDIIEKMINQI